MRQRGGFALCCADKCFPNGGIGWVNCEWHGFITRKRLVGANTIHATTFYGLFCYIDRYASPIESESICMCWGLYSSIIRAHNIFIDTLHMCRLCTVYNVFTWWRNAIKWRWFLRYWPFVWGIHRPLVNYQHSDAELWYFIWSASE